MATIRLFHLPANRRTGLAQAILNKIHGSRRPDGRSFEIITTDPVIADAIESLVEHGVATWISRADALAEIHL